MNKGCSAIKGVVLCSRGAWSLIVITMGVISVWGKSQIDNKPALVSVVTWSLTGNKSLSGPMLVYLY